MGIAEMVGIETMPSITVARISRFPAAEKHKYTNEVNSFGRSGVSVLCDSFFAEPQLRWCFYSNNETLFSKRNRKTTQYRSHTMPGHEFLKMVKVVDCVETRC